MSSKEYFILNIIFAALLFCLFISSYFVESDPLITCQILELTGKECNSCGLTRDFKSFSHFNFKSPLNSHSIFVYSWFMLQFILRLILIQIPSNYRDMVVRFDIIFTTLSGLAVFLPFWF